MSATRVAGPTAQAAVHDLGFARVDHDRPRRRRFPEAIFCPGKSTEQIIAIARSFHERGTENVLVTRADPGVLGALGDALPNVAVHADARLAVVNPTPCTGVGLVAVVAWRDADRLVAEEGAWTARSMGSAVAVAYDAPVGDPAALPGWTERIADARAIVAVDGTGTGLWTLIGGLSAAPVIAVPTSATSDLRGVPALLSAVTTCVPGVLAVNIDNGFGAGYAAHLINERCEGGNR